MTNATEPGHGPLTTLTEEELLLQASVRKFARERIAPHVREMDFTGRPMKGYVFVEPEGFDADAELKRWLQLALAFVGTVTAKPKRKCASTSRCLLRLMKQASIRTSRSS